MNDFWQNLLTNRKALFLIAILIAAVAVFNRLGESTIGGDDAHYSEIAKEMVRTGDYLSLHSAYRVDFHNSKPPMLFWMNALSGSVFGFNDFAMRLPSAILGFLGIVAFLFFVGKYFGTYQAFIGSLVLTFTQQYLFHARSAVTESPFTFFFAVSLMLFWMARTEKKAVYYYLMGLAIGLAVMTRQIPGLFIYPAILAYIVLAKEYHILKNPHLYGAALLSALVFLPWHILMYLRYGQGFLHQYFSVALMTGLKGYPASYSSNPSLNPWYAYGNILASNYEPWFLLFLYGIYVIVRNLFRLGGEERKKYIFLLCWAFVPLAIFQAAKVKQYHYINPLYVPFALITASAFASFSETARRRSAQALIVLFSVTSIVFLAYPVIPRYLDSPEFRETVRIVPEIKRLPGDIHTLAKGAGHYNSCFWFYADKRTVTHTEEELAAKIASAEPYNFILWREDFDRVSARAKTPLTIIATTKDSVLFTNSKEKH